MVRKDFPNSSTTPSDIGTPAETYTSPAIRNVDPQQFTVLVNRHMTANLIHLQAASEIQPMSAIDLVKNCPDFPRLPVPIHTARLCLRPFAEEDTAAIAALLADADTTQWIGGVKTETEALASVLRMKDSFYGRGWGTLAIVPTDIHSCIGYCGIRPLPHTQDAEIAFGLLRSHWNRGFATEASVACLQAAFTILRLPSVVATVYPGNTRSIAVLQKLRMTRERCVFGTWPGDLAYLFRVTRQIWMQSDCSSI